MRAPPLRSPATFLKAIIAALGVGCGAIAPGGGGGGGGGGSVPLEGFEAERIAALCEREARCGWSVSQEACILATDYPLLPDLLASVAAGRISYDPAAAHRCLEKIRAVPCDNNGLVVEALWPACEAEAFSGTVPAGGVCHRDDECGSLSCQYPVCDGTCCTGTCDPVPTPRSVPTGGHCSADSQCMGGASCLSYFDWSCVALGALGEPCVEACRPDLACGADQDGRRTCVPYVKPGASCVNAWCGKDEGAAVIYCDQDQICRATYSPGPGGACGRTDDAPCTRATYCLGGVCQPRAKVGDPCAPDSPSRLDDPCQQGFFGGNQVECREGRCVREPPPAPPPPCEYP